MDSVEDSSGQPSKTDSEAPMEQPISADTRWDDGAKRSTIVHDFITKSQFLAMTERYDRLLHDMKSDPQMASVQPEMNALLEKFKACYEAQQGLLMKVKELELASRIKEEKEIAIETDIKSKKDLVLVLEATKEHLSRVLAREQLYKKERVELLHKLHSRNKTKICSDKNVQTQEVIYQREYQLFRDRSDEDEETAEDMFTRLNEKVATQAATVFNQSSVIKKLEMQVHEKDVLIANMRRMKEKLKEQIRLQEINALQSEHTIKEMELFRTAYGKLQYDHEAQGELLSEAVVQRDRAYRDLGIKENILSYLEKEKSHLKEKNDELTRKILSQEETIAEKEAEIKVLFGEFESVEKETKILQKAISKHRDSVQVIKKERDALLIQTLKAEEVANQMKVDKKIAENKRLLIRKDLLAAKEKQEKAEKLHRESEKDKMAIKEEIVFLKKRVDDLGVERDLELKSHHVSKKTIAEQSEQILREQMKVKQAADDLNHSTKMFEAARAEFLQIKDKYGVQNRGQAYLKLIIQEKDDEQGKLKKMKFLLQREKQALIYQLSKKVQQENVLQSELKLLRAREEFLAKTVSEKEIEIQQAEKTIQKMKIIQDNLETALKAKSNEVVELTEKYKEMETNVKFLEIDNRKKQEDIKNLQLEISHVARHNGVLRRKMYDFDKTRQDLKEVQAEQCQDKAKARCLEEEMIHPVNIHRWRELEKHGPKESQLIMKNQTLQKRIFSKISEVKQKTIELEKKDKMINDMDAKMKRCHIDENISEKLLQYRSRIQKLKDMFEQSTSELRMYQGLCKENEMQISRMSEELKSLKMADYNRKHRLKPISKR